MAAVTTNNDSCYWSTLNMWLCKQNDESLSTGTGIMNINELV